MNDCIKMPSFMNREEHMTKEEFSLLFHRAQVNLVAFKQLYEPEAFEAMQRMVEMAIDDAIKPWAKQLKAERKRFEEYRDMTVGVMRDVRMDERKECAKMCEAIAGDRHLSEAQKCANAIRARGETK